MDKAYCFIHHGYGEQLLISLCRFSPPQSFVDLSFSPLLPRNCSLLFLAPGMSPCLTTPIAIFPVSKWKSYWQREASLLQSIQLKKCGNQTKDSFKCELKCSIRSTESMSHFIAVSCVGFYPCVSKPDYFLKLFDTKIT